MFSRRENETLPENRTRPKFDFSIDHILNRAGGRSPTDDDGKTATENCETGVSLPWLSCTRYCPPKIPRNQRREGPQKRQLGRHPRIPFTTQQLSILEDKFRQTPYLSSAEVTKLSRNLQLADVRVKIWFQNRRARERREHGQLESEPKIRPVEPKLIETYVDHNIQQNIPLSETELSLSSASTNHRLFSDASSFATYSTFQNSLPSLSYSNMRHSNNQLLIKRDLTQSDESS